MHRLTTKEARENFSEAVNRVAYGREHIAVQRRGKDMAYLIPPEDYELFQRLLEAAEDQADQEAVEEWLKNPNKERVPADRFFAEWEKACTE